MRIVHAVRSDSFSGVERYITYVAPEQAARGHEVVVIGGDPSFMSTPLAQAGVRHRAATSTGAVAKALLAERGFRPDVVHSHMTAADTASLAVIPLVRGTRVSTLHFAKPRGRSTALRRAWATADRAFRSQIAISRYVADTVGTRSIVVWNGLPDVDARGEARQRVVLVAQRFDVEKQTSDAVRAWQRSGLGAQGWELHLAGRGRERDACESLARELDVASSVRFLGMVDDLPDRMAAASVFLATAPAEPFGLSVVEAMRAGLPVVAARGGAHTELLSDAVVGDTSLLPAPGDVDAIAQSLVAVAGDDARRADLGRANRERFCRAFTVATHVDRLDAIYRAGRPERHGR